METFDVVSRALGLGSFKLESLPYRALTPAGKGHAAEDSYPRPGVARAKFGNFGYVLLTGRQGAKFGNFGYVLLTGRQGAKFGKVGGMPLATLH